jgi:SAM-dependent methyltransferase
VLEIGAGQGSVGSLLARRYDYLGLEPDRRSYETARTRIGETGRLRNIAVEQLPAGETFDLVCALEVLEHLEDDRGALALWSRHVRPGGWLLVSVPAGRDRFGASDAVVGHVRRYDRDDLGAALGSAGLVDVELRTYGFPLGYVLEAVRNQLLKRQDTSGPREERTAASGRWLPAPERLARPMRIATAPFRLLQRPFASTTLGTGLVGRARRPVEPS